MKDFDLSISFFLSYPLLIKVLFLLVCLDTVGLCPSGSRGNSRAIEKRFFTRIWVRVVLVEGGAKMAIVVEHKSWY